MKYKRVLITIITIFIIIVAAAIGCFVFTNKTNTNEAYKLKKNVNIIDAENNSIESCEEGKLVFTENPKLEMGDVVVIGITDATPNGGIFKVKGVSKENDKYVVKTTYGTLLDVFEEAEIEEEFIISPEGYMEKNNKKSMSGIGSISQVKAAEAQKQFEIEYNEEVLKNTEVSCKVGITITLKLKISIKDNIIRVKMTETNTETGEMSVTCGTSVEEAFEKELKHWNLKNIQFMAGPVPVVITNEMSVSVSCNAGIDGEISDTMDISKTDTVGFEYDSKTKKVTEINKHEYKSDGISWEVNGAATGMCSADLSIHYTAKLYGTTGIDVAAGIEGKAEATIETNVDMTETRESYVGVIDLVVRPVVSGQLIVDVPVIDDELESVKLFTKTLDPLWSEHWESSAEWKKELEELKAEKKQAELPYVIEENTETIWEPNGYIDTGREVPYSAFDNGSEPGATFDYAGHSYIITKIFYPSENARDNGRSNWQVYDLTENHYYYFLNTISPASSREGLSDELVLYLYDAY